MKALAVVNRFAGGAPQTSSLSRLLGEIGRAADVVYTEHPGHAREVVIASNVAETIVVIGGDGTLFEVMNSMDVTRQRLGLVPMGRGNSLARDLGLYPLDAAMRALRGGRPRRIDLLETTFTDTAGRERRYRSASTTAIGYPAAVARMASAWFHPLGRYCYAAAAALARPSLGTVRLAQDGQPSREERLTGLIASNTRHVANFVGFPGASPQDGAFDVMEMRAGRMRQNLHNLSALTRLYTYQPATLSRSTATSLTLDHPSDLMIDGELFSDVKTVNVRIQPRALEIICPDASR